MADPVTLGLLAVSVAASAASGVMGMSAAAAERQQYEDEASRAELQASQEEVVRREEAARIRSANLAMMSASGGTSDGRSFMALQAENERQLDRDVSNIRVNGRAGANSLRLGATQAKYKGYGAAIGAIGSISGTLAGNRSLLKPSPSMTVHPMGR